MAHLRLVSLDDVVVLPGMPVTLPADVAGDKRVFLIPQRGSGYAKVGVVAEVTERVALGGRSIAWFRPLHRAVPGAAQTGPDGVLRVEVDERPDPDPAKGLTRELEREYRAVVEEILELRDDDGRISAFVRSITHPGTLADTAGYSPDLSNAQKLELLETLDIVERLTLAVRFQQERLAELRVRQRSLDDVKQRITEYLAVRKLRADRGLVDDRRSGAILTLIGPPGTGKTSIGESIARATGRQFVRMSLGGVRDESEIRGHRRTYIGALPGRLVRALRDAGTMNPVILLDEVDKIGADWRGDPSAALLEVLDPAQNHSFRDHYLDVEVDLSEVVFIATANIAETIPGPLLDRMEVVRFDGYTTDEKVAIARGYFWPRQVERAGLREDEVSIDDITLDLIVSQYTREAGVRQLERELGKLLRKTATTVASGTAEPPITIDEAVVRDALGRQRFYQESAERTAVPGVATGLAVTGTGGDVLFVEATKMPGQDGLVLTGQLGDVMKESARIALSYVRSHADKLGLDENDFEDASFHVHVPAGAIPKDGPSA